LIGPASYWRYDDVETLNAHEAHTLAKKKKIEPTALNDQAAGGADGREVWCGVTAEGKAGSDEAGAGEIGAVVVVYLDLAGEDLLQKRINIAIPIRPVRIDKIKSNGNEDSESQGETE
jgi:hypothetical protein